MFGFQAPDISIGRVDVRGGPFYPCRPTPSEPNERVISEGYQSVRINEWLASNPNGSDGFELFNGGATPIDLGGCSLTDDVAAPLKHIFPPLTILGSGGAAHRWLFADGSSGSGGDQVGFRRSAGGESIALFDPGGGMIDMVAFGAQLDGVSEGRLPDGSESLVAFPNTGSPGAVNYRDLDGDHLPDAWEVQWNMNPAVASAVGHDTDLDGSDDFAEYLSGTDPTDPTSRLALGAALNDGSIELSFDAQPGAGYELETSGMDAASPQWSLLLRIKPQTNVKTIRYQHATGSGDSARIFRIRLLR